MHTTVTKEHIIQHQLRRAIEHYGEGDYIVAITLAGASEEIAGAQLKRKGMEPAMNHQVWLLQAIEQLDGNTPTCAKAWIERMNFARNELKHWHIGERGTLTLDWKSEAEQMIDRAITNCIGLFGQIDDFAETFLHNSFKRFRDGQ